MAYFMGKGGFVWWQGVVEDRHDPLYLGRCRVRVLGWHSEDKSEQPTDGLPWAYPVAPITSASQTGVGTTPLGPVEGTWVIGFYRDGEDGQEPMFFGTIGGIPELDAKGVNSEEGSYGGQGFLDPRTPFGDIGHPRFPDETIGNRQLAFKGGGIGQPVPREPASILHDSNPDPSAPPKQAIVRGPGEGGQLVANTVIDGPVVRSVITETGPGTAAPPFTVKVIEQGIRSTFPDTGSANTATTTTRNLNYMKEPTTNRLARGIYGNTDDSNPDVVGIVFEKHENRKIGQMNIPMASGGTWQEPKSPWKAIYPYNHVHQTESGHIIEMDDTPEWERLHWYHRTGTFTEIHPTGVKVDKIVNNYYEIILGSRHSHVEANQYTTIDGSMENRILGSKVERIDGSYDIDIKSGSFDVRNPMGAINLQAGKVVINATDNLVMTANEVIIEKKSSRASESTTGDEKKKVGGLYKVNVGSYSLNAQGSLGMQTGGGISLNVTDSITESIFGVLPSLSLGYAKNTTATLGKIGMECTDNLVSGGIEMNLGLKGLGASIGIKPTGNIELNSNLGTSGITGTALLGPVKFESVASDIQMGSLLSTFKLGTGGDASMAGLLGEVSVSSSGKVKVEGVVASLKEILDELVDIITEHTHPTGTGPSGPPMAPATAKLSLLKDLKIGGSFE